jgi:PIN domain nuclease of toxin-antitoxin system
MKRFAVILLATWVSACLSCVFAREPDDIKDGQRLTNAKRQAVAPVRADPKAIAKLIDDINAAARSNKQRILSIIVINTDVAASTLEQEKAQNGLTLGDVYVAHSLALATNKKVSAIFALHKGGKSWAEIAKSHGVTLKGSSELIKQMQKE